MFVSWDQFAAEEPTHGAALAETYSPRTALCFHTWPLGAWARRTRRGAPHSLPTWSNLKPNPSEYCRHQSLSRGTRSFPGCFDIAVVPVDLSCLCSWAMARHSRPPQQLGRPLPCAFWVPLNVHEHEKLGRLELNLRLLLPSLQVLDEEEADWSALQQRSTMHEHFGP